MSGLSVIPAVDGRAPAASASQHHVGGLNAAHRAIQHADNKLEITIIPIREIGLLYAMFNGLHRAVAQPKIPTVLLPKHGLLSRRLERLL